MPLVEKTLTIAAPIDVVFCITQNYQVRYDWDPFVEKISIVRGSYDELAIGALARFRYAIALCPVWLAWAFNWAALLYFSRTATQRLAGLKRYCESLA